MELIVILEDSLDDDDNTSVNVEGISTSSPEKPRMNINDHIVDITDTDSDEDNNSMIDDSGNKRKAGLIHVQ